MKTSIIIFFIILLSGCATQAPVVEVRTQIVKVPVTVLCDVKIPVKPNYNFDKLTQDDSLFDKVKALLADRILRDAYELELAVALNTCVK